MGRQFLTTHQAATYLQINPEVLRRWAREGRVTCYRLGNSPRYRFLKDDLDRLVLDTKPVTQGANHGTDVPEEPRGGRMERQEG